MSQGAVRRISERSSARKPNPMFAALENELHAVLIDRQPIPDYYVCKRLSSYPRASRCALIERMPDDIRALIASDSDFQQYVDTSELDLIDFLLNYKNNRVLSILGAVGIGKTTFIHYVLNDLRKRCPSLRHFVPIIMNCLRIGTSEPTYQDFIYEISNATRESLIDQSNIGLTDFNPLQALLTDSALEHTGGASSAHFVDFVSALKSACGKQVQPIIVFDNVDQLSPESVIRVGELGRAVHLKTGLCIVTALRPATHYLQVDWSRAITESW
jgi:Cdc6-like AAA superfamily ATPase